MRIIAGQYKGRTIVTVSDRSVRPAADRVRQTLFDMLANRMIFDGATVLDLFAGSGSLGLEALSRGAARVTFVEADPRAAACIEKNLSTLGCSNDADVYDMDALSYIRTRPGQFTLVFADPPYAYPETPEIPRMVFEAGLVRAGGYLLVEHAREMTFTPAPLFSVGPLKRFGRTVVTFFQENP